MSPEQDERLRNELSLLEAMYPAQVGYVEKGSEVKYSSDAGYFQLRLPDGYLVNELPEVISAGRARTDLRGQLKQHVQACSTGEEIIDSVIAAFNELAESCAQTSDQSELANGKSSSAKSGDLGKATIVVWLHHLLNTNKRKQALSLPLSEVSGLTKPGYPGVLIYSGPAKAVHEHVGELKQLDWAAFQVRLESDDEWTFTHGSGVKEVESMKDLVAEVGEKRELFMEAMRMK
ncbi:hypothetical protein LTR37_018358 [Vermiconidia calcicola]|uniref:Uncharacterized protein n=1 Tax=Vermiconidia calcicola TaxID=1690605 RepID=A0ACC3MIS1_9PEZI|nr:hypothetical protein LTR37_018358 [Vermiconidia calcicola]